MPKLVAKNIKQFIETYVFPIGKIMQVHNTVIKKRGFPKWARERGIRPHNIKNYIKIISQIIEQTRQISRSTKWCKNIALSKMEPEMEPLIQNTITNKIQQISTKPLGPKKHLQFLCDEI